MTATANALSRRFDMIFLPVPEILAAIEDLSIRTGQTGVVALAELMSTALDHVEETAARMRPVRPPQRPGAALTAHVEPLLVGDAVTRSTFTWRQNPEDVDALDLLTKNLGRRSGRKVTKAEALAALVDLANENSAVFQRLLAQFGFQERL